MTKRNIARSSESVDAFERPSESPERGALMEERFPTNYSVLLAGPPGVGKFEYLIARIREDLRLGERVVFVTLDMPPNEIRARAKALRLDLGAHEGKLFVFVDCYSATSSDRPEAAPGKKTFLVSSFSNLEGIGMAMSKAAQELGTPVRIYFYTISTLFPHNSTQPIARAKTGIPVLDDRLQGGFPRPSTLLLFSDKPTEKRIFGENFAVQGVKAGERSMYVDFFRAPQLARGEMKRFGSVDPAKLVLVDATSSQLLLPSPERYHIDDISSLENIREAIIAATQAEKPARIIVDSMEFLMDRFPKEDVLRLWRELIEAARAAGAVICFLFINWTLAEGDLVEIRGMSDFVVEFQSSLRGGIIRNSMRISQMAQEGIRTNWIPYTFKDLVGLTVYFPRILVTGPFNAGKSTVVKALSEKSV